MVKPDTVKSSIKGLTWKVGNNLHTQLAKLNIKNIYKILTVGRDRNHRQPLNYRFLTCANTYRYKIQGIYKKKREREKNNQSKKRLVYVVYLHIDPWYTIKDFIQSIEVLNIGWSQILVVGQKHMS